MAAPAKPTDLNQLDNDELIESFIQSPLTTAKELLKQPVQKQRFWQLLETHSNDPKLTKAYKYVEQILGVIPTPQPQPAPAPASQAIPTVTAEKLTQQEPAVTPKEKELEDLTPPERQKLEKWMNGIKPGFYEYLAEKKFDAATSQHMFTNSFLEYLAMYKGGLAGFYLSQGAHELMYSALGPIGEALSGLHQKDLKWKIAWMKNPLNPNALYYYLNVLPEESAFKLLFLPVKASWGILARGGAPLISKTTYRETNQRRRDYGQVKTGYFFSPTLRLAQGVNILADGLDKLTGIPTDDNFFRLDFSKPTPFDQYIKKKNHDFADALKEYKKAKTMGQPSRIFGANQKIKNLLHQYDGNFIKQWFKPGFSHLSRRLRQHHSDPISYLLALVGGTIFDIFVGIGANLVKVAANRALGLIPGYNALRVRLTEFLTSNRWLQTARIGGATGQAFLKGTFSMTTASSTYAGASVGGWIANALGLPAYPFQVIGGGVGATFGSIYTTSLKMSYTRIPAWVQEYQIYKNADVWKFDEGATWGKDMIKENYLKSLKPGPLTRFANWLHNNPFARLPINGFMIADLGVRFLGWSPWAYPSLIAGDYLWQVKGKLGQIIWEKWLGPPIKDFAAKIYGKYIFPRWAQFAKFGLPGEAGLTFIDKPWLRGLKNIWSKAQPYLRNFFNPGFLMGFSLTPLLTPALGGWAYLVGPVLGSAGWLAATRITASVIGYSGAGVGAFLARFNALGWTGFMIGQLTGWLIFGWNVPFWYTAAWSVGLPLIGTVIQTLAWTAGFSTISAFLGTALSTITGGFISALGATSVIASGLAIWATVTSIALVAGLTIFAGFVIYSAFWVPFQQVNWAGPESTFFSTQTTVTNSNGQLEICSKINVKNDLVTEVNYINHLVYNVFSGFTIADFDPSQPNKYVSRATRQDPYESLTNLLYNDSVSCPGFTNKNYSAHFDSDYILLPSLVGSPVHNTYLSTFTSCETGKKTIFELQLMFPQSSGLQQISDGYIDFLNQIKNDRNDGNNHNDTKAKLDATLDVLNKIISKFDDVVNLVKDAINQDSLASIQEKIDRAHALVETASKPENNPFIGKYDSFEAFQGDCNYQESTCREIYSIYQSYSAFFQGQLSTLYSLKRSADNPSANIVELKKQVEKTYYSLNSTLQDSKAQKQAIQDSKDLAVDLYGNDGFWNNWLSILTNLSGSQLTEIQNMLLAAFQDIFKKKFYFTPARTVYEVCLNAEWVRPDLLPYTFPVVVYFTNPPAMFNYNYFSPTVNFYTIPAP